MLFRIFSPAGPGKGALTLLLSKQVKLITAVEIDPKLVSLLKKTMPKNIIIQQGDILKFDPKILGINYKIIGNLLYISGIPHTKVPSSEIIEKVYKQHWIIQQSVKFFG